MKNIFKGFLLNLILLTFMSSYVEARDCPEPPDEALVSICGTVKAAMPVKEPGEYGEIVRSQKGVEGVNVYVYECDNNSPSCKNSGDLVYPFSSTTTNANGEFLIYMRKRDGNDKLAVDTLSDRRNESKERYLVFTCGDKFAGLKVVRVNQEWDELIKEVDCTEGPYTQEDPPDVLEFVNPLDKLSNHMGSEDEKEKWEALGTNPMDPEYEPYLTAQTTTSISPSQAEVMYYLELEGADPRFTKQQSGDYIDVAAATFTHSEIPTEGAFWGPDCLEKYKGTSLEKFCLGSGTSIASTPEETYRNAQLVEFEDQLYLENPNIPGEPMGEAIINYSDFLTDYNSGKLSKEVAQIIAITKLYNDPEWLIQNKFPNIPYQGMLLFYKELPARQDVVEIVQDPSDIARFNNFHFSNCAGEVFLRYEEADTEDKYPSCDIFRQCNSTLSDEDSYRNSYTTGGPAKQLMTPVDVEPLYYEVADLTTKICKMDPENEDEEPITLGDIQPPWEPNSENYKLDKSYWSDEYLFYFGLNNVAQKEGYRFFDKNDSYTAGKYAVNDSLFKAFYEASGVPMQGGTSKINPSSLSANSSVKAIANYTGEIDNYTNFLSPPTKDDDYKKEIVSQTAVYSLAGNPMIMGTISNVWGPDESIIIESADDVGVLNNNMFKGNEDHYPVQDLADSTSSFNIWKIIQDALSGRDIVTSTDVKNYYTYKGYVLGSDGNLYQYFTNGDTVNLGSLEDFEESHKDQILTYRDEQAGLLEKKRDGTRTPTSALYITSVADRRNKALNDPGTPLGNDFIDSLYSIMAGDGDLTDYSILPGSTEGLVDFYQEINKEENGGLFDWLIGLFNPTQEDRDENKSFLDRQNADENLGTNPGAIDDLHTTYPLSEDNFTDFFPLPNPGGPNQTQLVTDVPAIDPFWLDIEDWGSHDCYPWTNLGVNGTCQTSKEENDVSRTCRVDYCLKGETKIVWDCKVVTNIGGGRILADRSGGEIKIQISNEPCESDISKSADRLTCAQKQTSCLEKNEETGAVSIVEGGINEDDSTNHCIREVAYKTAIDYALEHPPSCPTDASSYIQDGGGYATIQIDTTIGTPACNMSSGGPYTCFGDLTKDSTFALEQQQLRTGSQREALDLSEAYVADNELRMSLQSPTDVKFTDTSYKAYSGDTSVRAEEDKNLYDTAKRVDNKGAGTGSGELNAAWVRSAFGPPTAREINVEYNPVKFHCNNQDLGSNGYWNCGLYKEPDPISIDLEEINLNPNKSTCDLNPSQRCRELIFGYEEEEEELPEFSETFIKVMSMAAEEYNIPASLILVYMGGIGKIGTYSQYWKEDAEENLLSVTTPWYGAFNLCSDPAWNAQGPYDWILKWFNASLDDYSVRSTLNSLATNRGNTASRCNFLDSTYTTAAALGNNSGSCGWEWENNTVMRMNLESLTFGFGREGAYAYDTRYYGDGTLKEIFNACKY